VIEAGGRFLVELEDVAQHYRRPSIIDIKVGYQTWYPGADPSYIQRCQVKDAQTTQAALGFKICGMQVCCNPLCFLPFRPSRCARY
jgi:1D-myo-inositol-tetrakisphosphate 5-kinase/inositol-polyphosphate multikinase